MICTQNDRHTNGNSIVETAVKSAIFREVTSPAPPPSLLPPIQQKSPILAYCSTINFLFPSRCSNVTKLIRISSNKRLYFLFKRLFRPVTRWQRLYTHRCLIILYR